MLNIIEKEDFIKGMSDADLAKHAMYPDGELPQFLTVSEIQRRGKMRASYAERQPDSTVAEQILQQSGIMSGTQPDMASMPQGMPQGMPQAMPPQGMPQGMPPQGMPPQGMPQAMPQGNMAALPSPPANINPMSGPPVMAASGGVVNLSNGGTGRIPTLEEMRGMYDLSDAVLLMKIKEMEEEAERKRSRSLSDAYTGIPQQASAYDASLEGVRPDFIDPSKEVSLGEQFSAPNIQEGGFVIPTFAAPSYVDDSVGNASDLEEMRRNRLDQAVRMQRTPSGGKDISERMRSLSEIAQNPRMPIDQRQRASQTAQDLFGYGTYGSDIIPAGIDAGGSVQGAPLSLIRQLDSGKFLAGPPFDQVVFNTEEEANAYLQELGMVDRAGPSAETIASEEAQGLAALLDRGVLSEEDAYKQTKAAGQKEFNAMMDRGLDILGGTSPIVNQAGPLKNLIDAGGKIGNILSQVSGLNKLKSDIASAREEDDESITEYIGRKLGGGEQIAGGDDARVDVDQTGVNGQVDPAALMRKRQKAAKGEGEYAGYSIIGLDGGMPAPSGLDPRFNPFGSTASSELRALRGKPTPAPDFMGPTLGALGAGIAGGDLAGGLRDASKIAMQQKQYEAKAAQADLDRDVKILSEAGRIDAYIRTAEAQAKKLAAAGNVDASKLIFDILDYSETRPLNERAAYVYSSMSTMLQQYPQLRSTIVPIMNSAKQDLQKQRAMEE